MSNQDLLEDGLHRLIRLEDGLHGLIKKWRATAKEIRAVNGSWFGALCFEWAAEDLERELKKVE